MAIVIIKLSDRIQYGIQMGITKNGSVASKMALNAIKEGKEFSDDTNFYTKDEVIAMLTDIKLKIREKEQYYQNKFIESTDMVHDTAMCGRMFGCGECKEIIRQKINELKGEGKQT